MTHASRVAVAVIATCGVAQIGSAQVAPQPSTQARIDALEAELHRVEADLAALRQQANGSAAPGSVGGQSATVVAQGSSQQGRTDAPTSAAIADVAKGVPGTAQASAIPKSTASPRIFGAGIPTTAAVARIEAGHPAISTSDGRFTASLLGIMQFDVADYFQRSAGPLNTDLRRAGSAGDNSRGRNLSDGTTFRRARIGIAGKAFGDFEYSVLFDFGGSGVEDNGHVQELWLQYSGLQPAHVRAGAFAPFIGLEDAGSTNGMMFLERPASADIARSLAGGDYREAGQIAFTGKQWFASAAVTGRLVNAAGSSAVQPYQSQLGFIGRAGLVPIKSDSSTLHLAVHGSYVDHPANTAGPDASATAAVSPIQLRERPELRVDGTRLIDTGAIDAVHAYTTGAEFAAQHKSFLVQGEYERYGIERRASPLADPRFHGYYVEASWMITGEQRRYNDGNYAFDGPAIKGSFNPLAGNWGAWELALRWSDMNLNYHQGAFGTAPQPGAVRGGDQRIATAGLNWYFNSIARIMFDYQHVTIDRLSPNATTFVTPLGAQVGQTYSTGSVRFQLAF